MHAYQQKHCKQTTQVLNYTWWHLKSFLQQGVQKLLSGKSLNHKTNVHVSSNEFIHGR